MLAAPLAFAQDLKAPKRELDELRQRIESLERTLSQTRSTRDEALDAVKRSAQALDSTERELDELQAKRAQIDGELASLRTQKSGLEARVKAAQRRIATLYYRGYVKGETPLAAQVLSGENPNETGRRLQYNAYLARSHAAVIAQLRSDLSELKQLRDASALKARQLSAVTREEKDKHGQLLSQHDAQKQQVASLESRIAKQKDTIEEYRRDEAKLSQLIQRLTQEIAAKQKREAERKRKAALARAKRNKARQREALPPEPTEQEVAPVPGGAFAKLKGRLARPVAGELTHRFGSPRSEGGLSWKGIFLRAAGGAPVRAVASGEVVFADWLRGFGQLLIVDHGDGYMSLYGNNGSLQKRVGESVRSGETVARVGATGSNLETGLYFELRYRSRALNPLSWLGN